VVTIDERVLRVGSDMYPVSAMSAVHVDTWRPHEGRQARRQFLRTSIYAGLPVAVTGIGVLREGQTHTLVGGLLLGVGSSSSGSAWDGTSTTFAVRNSSN
jgi:hypothetical protein